MRVLVQSNVKSKLNSTQTYGAVARGSGSPLYTTVMLAALLCLVPGSQAIAQEKSQSAPPVALLAIGLSPDVRAWSTARAIHSAYGV